MKNVTAILFSLCLFLGNAPAQNLVINEFLAGNDTTNVDPDYGENSDWIEIYNSGISQIDLSGYYLSDKTDNITKWQIPSGIVLDANSFLIVWADNYDTTITAMHTNFALSKSGEAVVLTNSDGTTVVDSILFGAQTDDISYGRAPDGGSTWNYFSPPTPGSSNVATSINYTESQIVYNYKLYQNYPNPFNPVTTIKYNLPSSQKIKISVYNVSGQNVADLFVGYQKAGMGEVRWDATKYASGIYYYSIKTNNFSAFNKMILLR